MLTHTVFFTNLYGQQGNKEGIYRRYYMLDILIFMAVHSAGHY